MKIKYIFFTLATLAFLSKAQAQVKVGNNPSAIGTNSALEVEATNGKKVIVDKAIGTTTVQSLSVAATTDSIVTASQTGMLNQISMSRLAQFLKNNYALGGGNGSSSVGTCPGLDYTPSGVAANAPGNATVPGTSISVTKIGSEFSAGATAGGHKYVLYSNSAGINWFQAQALAKSLGGYLPVVTSANEWNYIKANILSLPQASNFAWLGYRKFDSPGNTTQFNWITCEQSEFNYTTWTYNTYWTPSEPNNQGGNEGCGQIYPTSAPGRTWNDIPCATTSGIDFTIIEFNQ